MSKITVKAMLLYKHHWYPIEIDASGKTIWIYSLLNQYEWRITTYPLFLYDNQKETLY